MQGTMSMVHSRLLTLRDAFCSSLPHPCFHCRERHLQTAWNRSADGKFHKPTEDTTDHTIEDSSSDTVASDGDQERSPRSADPINPFQSFFNNLAFLT